MVCGKNKLDIIDFKNHTEYYGYKSDDNTYYKMVLGMAWKY